MPSKIDMDDIEIDEAPTSVNPYKVLSLDKEATADQVKTAYRKAALKWHPDKAQESDKEAAHTKFQEIAFSYAILSDTRRRKRYDQTGRTSDSLDLDDSDDFDWTAYYREQFANVITGDAIASFTAEYKGSAEEREHLLEAYQKAKGDMTKVYQQVMTSNAATDDARFRQILHDAIAARELEPFVKFTQESDKSIKARIKKAGADEKEAEAYAETIGVHDKLFGAKPKAGGDNKAKAASGGDSLAAMIQQRQKGRADDFFANLEAKYAPKVKKGKKRSEPEDVDEPPEEAFARNAKKVDTAKKARKVGVDVHDAAGTSTRSKRSRA